MSGMNEKNKTQGGNAVGNETSKFFFVVSFAIILIHLFYFIFFMYKSYTYMSVYNSFAIFLYIAAFYMLKKKRIDVAINIAIAEILIQTVVASVMLGNEWGFYMFNFIAVIPTMLRFQSGSSTKLRSFNKHLIMIFFDMLSFYLAYYLHLKTVPFYGSNDSSSRMMFMVNAGFSFFILILVLHFALKSSLSMTQSALSENKRLNTIASTDALTGLMNRRSMGINLNGMYDLYVEDGTPFSILMLDVDYFKRINDTYGHAVGDKVLIHMSEIINSKLRYGDTASRWGGEEFLVGLSSAGKSEAVSVAERIRLAISETPAVADGITVEFRVTIGVATIEPGLTVEGLISEADKKLYIGKQSGRNRVVV